MAITKQTADLWLRLQPQLRRHGAILHIGEPNLYGEVPPGEIILPMIEQRPPSLQQELRLLFDRAAQSPDRLFDLGRMFFWLLMEPSAVFAVDWGGTADAIRADLNQPVRIPRRFDLAVNNGTAEHVFEIGTVFRSMHDRCIVGGLMVHEAPFQGWDNHGLYALQPVLFEALAKANGYETILDERLTWRKGQTLLFVALRKTTDAPFVVPIQGCYESHRPG